MFSQQKNKRSELDTKVSQNLNGFFRKFKPIKNRQYH